MPNKDLYGPYGSKSLPVKEVHVVELNFTQLASLWHARTWKKNTGMGCVGVNVFGMG